MTEFEINGNQYRIGKLSAFNQFHVSRKIAPILPTLIPVFVKLSKGGGLSGDLSGFAEVLEPFTEGIAAMSDEASEYVLNTCLSIVQRNNDGAWRPVWSQQHKACMFEDIDLSVMINLAIRVIRDSLEPFIRGLVTGQQTSPVPAP